MSSTQYRVNKRSSITLQQRIEILQKLEKGVPIAELAISYGICTKSIQRIKRNAVEVRQLTEQETNLERKRRRTVNCKDLDEKLYTWFLERRALGDTITDLLLREKALEFVNELGGPSSFTASKGWVWRFKNRYRIRLIGVHGEKDGANRTTTEKSIQNLNRLNEKENIDEDVYNIDEMECMWRNFSQEIAYANEKKINGKHMKKDHVTDEVHTSATDSYELPHLSIHENPNLLPILKPQKATWMNQEFTDWYNNHIKAFVRRNLLESDVIGKLLSINNSKGHVSQEENLQDNYHPLCLLTDATSIIESLDQEIVEKIEQIYYKHCILKHAPNFRSKIKDFYRYYNIRDYFNMLCILSVGTMLANIQKSCRILGQTPDTEEDISTNSINPQELIKNIVEENIASNALRKWLTFCTKAGEENWQEQKRNTEDAVEKNIELKPSDLNDEEVKRAFAIIFAWAKTQNDFVKFHVKILKNFYDQQ